MKPLLVAAAAAFMLVQPVHSQTSKHPTWPKEPSSIFGMRIGEPLNLEDIRSCGAGPGSSEPESKISFCKMDAAAVTGPVSLGGFGVNEFRSGVLDVEDGVATALSIFGWQSNYRDIRDILIERYGQPTARLAGKVQTKSGVRYPSEKLVWTGKRLLLTLNERAGDIDTTVIRFSDIRSLAHAEEQRKQENRGSASKM